MFLPVPAYPGCPGSKAVKRSSLLLLLLLQNVLREFGIFARSVCAKLLLNCYEVAVLQTGLASRDVIGHAPLVRRANRPSS